MPAQAPPANVATRYTHTCLNCPNAIAGPASPQDAERTRCHASGTSQSERRTRTAKLVKGQTVKRSTGHGVKVQKEVGQSKVRGQSEGACGVSRYTASQHRGWLQTERSLTPDRTHLTPDRPKPIAESWPLTTDRQISFWSHRRQQTHALASF